jgi:CO/xanthine dehydrogenase Mo-binding subunit
MPNVLVVAELADGETLKAGTLSAITFAKAAAPALGGSFDILAMGTSTSAAVAQLKKHGASKVITCEDASFKEYVAEQFAPTVAEVGKAYSAVFATATTFGKDLLPRVAARLGAAYAGDCAAVTVEGGKLSVDRVVSAIDCGFAVNPLGVRAQVEGGINDALSTALGQEITIKDGAVVERNFDTYRMMRLADSAREIEVHIVASPRDPTGVGEPPVPPFAPALCNAIFAATGKRIRTLPVEVSL